MAGDVRPDSFNDNPPQQSGGYERLSEDAWRQPAGREEPPSVWQRADGGRYFDGAQNGDSRSNQGTAAKAAQSRMHDTLLGNGLSIRQYKNNPNLVDLVDENGNTIAREGVKKQGQYSEIAIRQPNNRALVVEVVRLYPNNTMDRVDPASGAIRERIHPDGARDSFDDRGRLSERRFPDGTRDLYAGGEIPVERRFVDGSWEKLDAAGRVTESKFGDLTTRYDQEGRRLEILSSKGDKWSFSYNERGDMEKYSVLHEDKLIERGKQDERGFLVVERLQGDGSYKIDQRLDDRVKVALRPNLTLDYLDREGFGLPDAEGRLLKRDDRVVVGMRQLAEGGVELVSVNPIRAVKMPNGQRIDYEYQSDENPGARSGADDIKSYTVKDAKGEITEFATLVPRIPIASGGNSSAWLEFKAAPGQKPISPEAVQRVKELSKSGTPQEMIERQKRLVAEKPLLEYLPSKVGQETVAVGLDQSSGARLHQYAAGGSRIIDERGVDTVRNEFGDSVAQFPDGRKVLTARDANPRSPGDRVTVIEPLSDGRPGIRFHHSRSDQSKLAFVYANRGSEIEVKEVLSEKPDGTTTKLVRDQADSAKWVEFRKGVRDGANVWEPTDKVYSMRVESIQIGSRLRLEDKPLPPGTIAMTLVDGGKPVMRRFITPDGIEAIGRVSAENPDQAYLQNLSNIDSKIHDPRQRERNPNQPPIRR